MNPIAIGRVTLMPPVYKERNSISIYRGLKNIIITRNAIVYRLIY